MTLRTFEEELFEDDPAEYVRRDLESASESSLLHILLERYLPANVVAKRFGDETAGCLGLYKGSHGAIRGASDPDHHSIHLGLPPGVLTGPLRSLASGAASLTHSCHLVAIRVEPSNELEVERHGHLPPHVDRVAGLDSTTGCHVDERARRRHQILLRAHLGGFASTRWQRAPHHPSRCDQVLVHFPKPSEARIFLLGCRPFRVMLTRVVVASLRKSNCFRFYLF